VNRCLPMVAAVAALLGATAAQAATRVLVVSGLGGEAQYEERFSKWSEQIAQASATATGDPDQVQRLSGRNARKEQIQAALKKAADELKAGDQLVLVLIGHGSYDGSEYRFNIEGPDITGSELAAMLDRIPAQQLVVNATSASGALADQLATSRRVVITATRSGGERNATRFGGYWAEALTSDAADVDKDGNVTAREAFDYAVRRVADAYKADNAILTERARLEGREPARFVVSRLGPAALFASDQQLAALRAEQDQIIARLAGMKALKADLPEDEYYARIEPVLLELARVGERIDARFAALGVKLEEDGNAM
jgi:hypothetical protein